MLLAPRAANVSDTRPTAGFADIPENPSEPPHFKPTHNWERGGSALTSVRIHEPDESRPDGFRKHLELGAALLLLKYKNGFAEMRITPGDLFPENGNLWILASETENGRSGDIRMMDIPGEQPTKIVGIFARSATATLVHQKLDSIYILENLGAGGRVGRQFRRVRLDRFGFAFSIKPDQLRYLLPIDIRLSKTQFLLKRLF
jgi:hypothetical protein